MATLVNSGLEQKARLIGGITGGDPFQWIALGTDDTAVANDDTALGIEITTVGGERKLAGTIEYEADYKCKWIVTFNFTGTLGINEVGLFDQLVLGGVMLMRHVWATTKNVENGDTLQITIRETEARV